MHGLLFIMQHWQTLAPHGPDRLRETRTHSATYFRQPQLGIQGNLLFVVGGVPNADYWICDINNVEWKRVSAVCKWCSDKCTTHSSYDTKTKMNLVGKYILLIVILEVAGECIKHSGWT